jgi:bifunctional non-homologous end joining protein LigD
VTRRSGAAAGTVTTVDAGGRPVRFTNPDKVLWPATGTTKGELLAYYRAVAPVLLPHIGRRPMTLGRWPDGTAELGWFQTTCPHPPGWIGTQAVAARRSGGRGRVYCLIDDEAALVWAVNLGTIEFHPLLARVPRLDQPDCVLFDLDPGDGVGLEACCAVALALQQDLAADGLAAFPKTSGQFGLHVVVPLGAGHDWPATKAYARRLAARLAGGRPDLVVDRMERARRQGKVFIDWSQNDASKSTVAPYSLRAMPWPSASTPLRWEEVADGAAGRETLRFDAGDVRRRLDDLGDLFRPVLDLDQRLPDSG